MNASALELAGMLTGCGAVALAVLASDPRVRVIALVVALVVAPALVAGNVWDEERVVRFREEPAQVAAAAIGALVGVAAIAALIRRLPDAFPVLALAVLPLRVPVEIGGETANLLIPLYVVIAAGVLASAWTAFAVGAVQRDGPSAGRSPAWWLRAALAATLVLYAVQTAYSEDVSNAIETAGFFLIPFGALFVLLGEVRWTRRLLAVALVAVVAMAAAFALVAVYQYAARDIWLNPGLEDSNELHLYFRTNSVFFDPNILGRYLALALTALAAYLAWGSERRLLAAGAATGALLIAALAFSFSITSFAAAIGGLGVLALLRWQWRGVAAAAALGLAALAAFALAGGTPTSEIENDRAIDSGHLNLISGGVDLAEDRPAGGWGSGAFGVAYFEQTPDAKRGEAVVSHAEPVTVAAEQGAVGLLLYLALVGLAILTLLGGGVMGSAPRTAIAACFAAMLVHSLGYAGFTTDPATWALLALGVALRADSAGG